MYLVAPCGEEAATPDEGAGATGEVGDWDAAAGVAAGLDEVAGAA